MKMAPPERLELTTAAFEAQCSIQLSYGGIHPYFTFLLALSALPAAQTENPAVT